MNDTDARLWHPWLRINCVLRVMLQTLWNAERGRRKGKTMTILKARGRMTRDL